MCRACQSTPYASALSSKFECHCNSQLCVHMCLVGSFAVLSASSHNFTNNLIIAFAPPFAVHRVAEGPASSLMDGWMTKYLCQHLGTFYPLHKDKAHSSGRYQVYIQTDTF